MGFFQKYPFAKKITLNFKKKKKEKGFHSLYLQMKIQKIVSIPNKIVFI
jgi:hypothetical protein